MLTGFLALVFVMIITTLAATAIVRINKDENEI